MKIKLYQIEASDINRDIIFEGLDEILEKSGGRFPSERYRCVFDGDVEAKDTEELFYIFNMRLPNGYKGRSMSVSDVVEFENKPGNSCFLFCERIGFKEISFNAKLVKSC